jgi:hypothetical protein
VSPLAAFNLAGMLALWIHAKPNRSYFSGLQANIQGPLHKDHKHRGPFLRKPNPVAQPQAWTISYARWAD